MFGRFFCAAISAAAIFTVGAAVASAEADVVSVSVDNSMVEFDQDPIIIDGHTMVPIRAVFEKAGAEVEWDQETQTATISREGYTVTVTYGDTAMYKNGERVELESPATMENDRILIPVRAIAEAMDYAVTWNGQYSLVLVSTNGKPYRGFAYLKTGFKTLADAAEYYSTGDTAAGSVDIDNDGTDETVEFSPTLDTSRGGASILKINGLDYTAALGSLTSAYSAAVVDIDRSDDTKEIVLTENGDTLTAHFYRYADGALTAMGDTELSVVRYQSQLLFSGTGYIISDLTGVCFTDIMVSGGLYYIKGSEITIGKIDEIDKIFGRNLYRTYDDNMLYHIIYTSAYTPGSYKDITDTGVIDTSALEHFKILSGYLDVNDPRYLELYIELSSGDTAVITPYQT